MAIIARGACHWPPVAVVSIIGVFAAAQTVAGCQGRRSDHGGGGTREEEDARRL